MIRRDQVVAVEDEGEAEGTEGSEEEVSRPSHVVVTR